MSKTAERLALIMSVLVVGTALYGCKKKDDTQTTGETAAGSPTEISIFIDGTSTTCDRNNNPVIREMEKKTNTKLKIVEAPNGQGNEKLNLLIASGEVPMIVKGSGGLINKYGIEGSMYAMDDIVDKYMPNAKQYLTGEGLNMLKASDNKLYTIPLIRDTGAYAYFVREDWMKKLNLKAPTTLDEYYDLLKAFTKNDPDGNKKDDTFGTTLGENLDKFELICGPFGIPTADWIFADDGSLVFSAVDPKMKEALAFGVKLYKEKLMNTEFTTLKGQQFDELVTNNKIGIEYTYSSGNMKLQALLQKTVPDAKYSVMTVPTAPGVKKGVAAGASLFPGTDKSVNGTIGVSKTVKDKDLKAVAKFIDWHFTEEGARVNTFGVENTHYTMENGKPKFKAEYSGADNVANRQKEGVWDAYMLCGFMDQKTDGWPQVWDKESIDNMNGTIKNAWSRNVYYTTPTGDAVGTEINKTRYEMFTKIIMGGVTIDEGWAQWLKEFDRLGGNKWTKEVNDVWKARK